MAPFDILTHGGTFWGYLVSLVIGLGFGAVLEMSGFGDSRKLAAQFYLRDLTVLKVMFTAIIVAMSLIFLFSALNLLDTSRLYVSSTHLLPYIVGGLIMGVGFIIGGFCPGTSVVAMATLKVDGLFFVLGAMFGVFVFGETVVLFSDFFNGGDLGRFTLPQWLGLDAGVVVLIVLAMAFLMFYWAEIAEQFFGQGKARPALDFRPRSRSKWLAGLSLVALAVITIALGQPDVDDRWGWIEEREAGRLARREVQIHPGELLEVMNDAMLYARLVDVRPETEFNLFHLEDAENIPVAGMADSAAARRLLRVAPNTVVVLMSNGETGAERAYRILKGMGVLNLYILGGGINAWLDTFSIDPAVARPVSHSPGGTTDDESLRYRFLRSVGDRIPAANPARGLHAEVPELAFAKKVTVQKKKAISGGCD